MYHLPSNITETGALSRFLRWMLALGYALLGSAGVLLLLSPAVAETNALTAHMQQAQLAYLSKRLHALTVELADLKAAKG